MPGIAGVAHASQQPAAAVCRPVDSMSKVSTVEVDGRTGDVRPRRLGIPPQGSFRVLLTNKNPFKYTYSIKVDSTPAASAAPAVLGALASWAGLPGSVATAVTANKLFAAPVLSTKSDIDTALLSRRMGFASLTAIKDPDWTVGAGCGAAAQAQVYLDYLSTRLKQHESMRQAVEIAQQSPGELSTLRDKADGVRQSVDLLTSDGLECASAEAPVDVVTKFEVSNTSRRALSDLLRDVDRAVEAADAIGEGVEFYEAAFDKACQVPGILELKALTLFDPKVHGKTALDLADVVAKAEAAAKTTKTVLANPYAFYEERYVHPGGEPATTSVVVRRLKDKQDGDGAIVADAKVETGDTGRLAVGVGFLTGKADSPFVRYQPILQTGVPGDDGAPKPATSVVGKERETRWSGLPVALVHYRPIAGFRAYVSGGAGPSGESGANAIAYFAGLSVPLGSGIMVTAGKMWAPSQQLPSGISVGSLLPDGADSVPTEKRINPVWVGGLTFMFGR